MKNVLLYKEGDSKTVRGVKCDLIRIEARQISDYLMQGYKLKVEDLYKPRKAKKKEV